MDTKESKQLDFNKFFIWVQLLHFPEIFQDREIVENNLIESSCFEPTQLLHLELYPKHNDFAEMTRVKVLMDIKDPIPPGFKLPELINGIEWIQFAYEFLPIFYFRCGFIGHIQVACNFKDVDFCVEPQVTSTGLKFEFYNAKTRIFPKPIAERLVLETQVEGADGQPNQLKRQEVSQGKAAEVDESYVQGQNEAVESYNREREQRHKTPLNMIREDHENSMSSNGNTLCLFGRRCGWPSTLEELKKKIAIVGPFVILVMETKCSNVNKATSMIRRLGDYGCFVVLSIGLAGGMWLIWESFVTVEVLNSDSWFIHSNDLIMEEQRLMQEHNVLLVQQAIHWGQKSCSEWYKFGDLNTKFFHTMVKCRRQKSFIHRIRDPTGIILTERK
ncbi:hypothetical protein IFM89_018511 [Coptis chinensis]|uniref:Zinc knuckle CX2CX4HX4C domain-containing protein n=1 Tax=Coptis chinensis TaxID=261450 RepID=A0A835MBV2_9MAGN|nr:hypothetical protein IFM89_018511 [Coptis chinensis]